MIGETRNILLKKNMMQKNTQTDKITLKRREDIGWINLKNQLDIELPQKKRDRRFLWLFFLLGVGLTAGYAFFRTTSFQETPSMPDMSKESPATPAVPDDQLMEVGPQTDLNVVPGGAPVATSGMVISDRSSDGSNSALQKNDFTEATKFKNQVLPNPGSDYPLSKEFGSAPNKYQPSKSKYPRRTIVGHAAAASLYPGYLSGAQNKSTGKEDVPAATSSSVTLRNLFPEGLLPYRSADHLISTVDVIALNSKIMLQEYEVPVSLVPSDKGKPNWYLQAGMGNLSDHHWNSSVLAGMPLSLSSKLYLTFNTGVAIQYGKNSGLTAIGQQGTFQTSAPGALKQSDPTSLYSVDASKVFLGAPNSLTGYRNDTLFISNTDKVTYHESARIMGILRAGLGWNVFSHFYLESGFDFRQGISKNQDKLLVEYATPVTNGLTNNIVNAGTFKVDHISPIQRTSLYFQAGYMLNRRFGINVGLISRPLQSGSQSSLQPSADRSNTSGVSSSAFKATGQQPFMIDFNFRYRF